MTLPPSNPSVEQADNGLTLFLIGMALLCFVFLFLGLKYEGLTYLTGGLL